MKLGETPFLGPRWARWPHTTECRQGAPTHPCPVGCLSSHQDGTRSAIPIGIDTTGINREAEKERRHARAHRLSLLGDCFGRHSHTADLIPTRCSQERPPLPRYGKPTPHRRPGGKEEYAICIPRCVMSF